MKMITYLRKESLHCLLIWINNDDEMSWYFKHTHNSTYVTTYCFDFIMKLSRSDITRFDDMHISSVIIDKFYGFE